MKTFVVGDLHGSYKGLVQALKRSKFNYKVDRLITLGDIVDGWEDSYRLIEELLKIDNRIDIRGNHDNDFHKFIETTIHGCNWDMGGLSTAKSYGKKVLKDITVDFKYSEFFEKKYITNLNVGDIPKSHSIFFRRQVSHYKDKNNNLFIHGGFNKHVKLCHTLPYTMMWDRHLMDQSLSAKATKTTLKFVEDFNKIFIGHTPTLFWGTDTPIFADRIINLDTGAGSGGKVTIMNVETFEYWQSDNSADLYPDDPHLRFCGKVKSDEN
jgi:serine/threonine protein phosphatase 1